MKIIEVNGERCYQFEPKDEAQRTSLEANLYTSKMSELFDALLVALKTEEAKKQSAWRTAKYIINQLDPEAGEHYEYCGATGIFSPYAPLVIDVKLPESEKPMSDAPELTEEQIKRIEHRVAAYRDQGTESYYKTWLVRDLYEKDLPSLLSMARRTLAAETENKALTAERDSLVIQTRLESALLRHHDAESEACTDALEPLEAAVTPDARERLLVHWELLESLPGLVNPGYPVLEDLYHAELNKQGPVINEIGSLKKEIERLEKENADYALEVRCHEEGVMDPSQLRPRCSCHFNYPPLTYSRDTNPDCPVHGENKQ